MAGRREAFLPYARQTVDEDDVRAVVGVLRSDWLTTGPAVEAFERAFALAVGARHAVALSSGTAALHAAVRAAGVGPGDECVTTPLTFVASANCALYAGARPVFADVRNDTLTLDPARVAERITPRTKAILPVDLCGLPADLEELEALARRAGAVLIEDAAHALGATYRGRPVGGLARLTVFSTHPVKHVTTGEGGVVTTDDPDLAAAVRRFRNHGIDVGPRERQEAGEWFYRVVELGFNYRLSDIQAALGTSQLAKLPRWLERRREISRAYDQAFAGMPELELPARLPDRESAWHLYAVRLVLPRLKVGRREVFRALRQRNIGVNVHYIPVPRHPYYLGLGYDPAECPVAEAAYERLISLPMWPGMSDGDVADVVEAVREVLAEARA